MKCWICETEYTGECPKCGPPQPMGPTPAELAEERRCKNRVLDEDGEDCGPCGNEGELCESCERAEAEYWLAQWKIAPLSERDPERYREEMIDAGRGHLLPPE